MKKRTLRVVVIEDDPELQELFEKFLKENEIECVLFDVVKEETAQEIITMKPDVVISDIKVPGDGFELADLLIKEHHPPVIFMTAFGTPVDLQGHGAVALLRKPFLVDELTSTIEAAALSGWKRPLHLQDPEERRN